MKSKLISLIIALCSIATAIPNEITITPEINLTFADPTPTQISLPQLAYASDGIVLTSYEILHAPLFPFSDGWGLHSMRGDGLGYFDFFDPVDFVEISAILNMNGPENFRITAFDGLGNVVDVESAVVNDPGPYGDAVLRLDAPGGIARVEVWSDAIIGIDSVKFGPVAGVPEVPGTAGLVGIALAGLALVRRLTL